ncbi:MAG: L,D-transpeptidase family protein [Rhodobacteraceae bacterium]|nr:L,D-transpeptidase family protein [Paracoccaceae bacterium]
MVLTKKGVRFGGRLLPCTIGKGGLSANKCEGDGATPTGTHHIVGMFYRADRIARPTDWATPIGPQDLWSDDAARDDYNHLVTAPYSGSHEKMRRADPLYDLVLATDWNWPDAQPGKGSAIFIHQWRRRGYPTEGCIAFSRSDLHWLARLIKPGSRVIVPELAAPGQSS